MKSNQRESKIAIAENGLTSFHNNDVLSLKLRFIEINFYLCRLTYQEIK